MAGDRFRLTPKDGGETAASPGAAARYPALDLRVALARAGGDAELLHEAGQIFLEQAGQLLVAIEGAIQRVEGAGLKSAAHSLKGSLGFFEACSAARLAAELERRGGAGIWEGTAELAGRLRTEVSGVTAAIQERCGVSDPIPARAAQEGARDEDTHRR